MDRIVNWSRAAYLLALLFLTFILGVPIAVGLSSAGLTAMLAPDEVNSQWTGRILSMMALGVITGLWIQGLTVRDLRRQIAIYEKQHAGGDSDSLKVLCEEQLFWALVLSAAATLCGIMALHAVHASQSPSRTAVGFMLIGTLPGIVCYAATRLRSCELITQWVINHSTMHADLRDSPLTSNTPAPVERGES